MYNIIQYNNDITAKPIEDLTSHSVYNYSEHLENRYYIVINIITLYKY